MIEVHWNNSTFELTCMHIRGVEICINLRLGYILPIKNIAPLGSNLRPLTREMLGKDVGSIPSGGYNFFQVCLSNGLGPLFCSKARKKLVKLGE